MKRLLALRVIEEEREETELRRQRQLRQICLDALNASEARQALALRALHTALDCGDGPMERYRLQRRLAQLEAAAEGAAAAWRDSRVRRLQIETIVETAETKLHKERQTREQKRLDGWFLSSRPQKFATSGDENSQRETRYPAKRDGTVRADSVHE